MKKATITLLILALAFPLFASGNELFAEWNGSFRPVTSSMGNAGLFLKDPENVYRNPSLVDSSWHVVFPQAAVRVFGIGRNEEVLNTLMESGDFVPAAIGYLNNIPGGFKNFIEAEGRVYLGAPYVGFGADFGFGLMTDGNGDVTTKLVSHVNAAFTLSGAYEFRLADGYSMSVGLGIGAKYKMASMDSKSPYGIGVETVSEVIENTKDGLDIPGAINELFKNDVDYSTGWSYPASIGVTFTFPYGFTAGIAASSINPDWHMYSYNEMNDAWAGDFAGGDKGRPFTLEGRTDLSAGFAWEMDNFLTPWWLRIRAALDFTDILGFWEDGDWQSFDGYVDHLRMGAEVSLLTALEVRAGLDRGYFTGGVGINLWGNRLDLIYGVRPYGKVIYGDALDYAAIVFTLGWENY